MNKLKLIGRDSEIFKHDINGKESELKNIVSSSSFLAIGGTGFIGQAVTKEIFKRNPIKFNVVDISENNLVELVRNLRGTYGYINVFIFKYYFKFLCFATFRMKLRICR